MIDITIQDQIKRCYQRFLGVEHMLPSEADALARLESECAALPPAPADEPLFEPLGDALCRLHLRPALAMGITLRTLARMFTDATNLPPDPAGFAAALDEIQPQTEADRAYLADYRNRGCPPVHHSAAYREAYAPAYRVVPQVFARAAQVFAWVDKGGDAPLRLLSIDGPCASGKTTLAAALHRIYGCAVLHADDFFLQPPQRTEARLAEPGGNLDRERFAREVLAPLRAGRDFTFRPYDCGTQALAEPVSVQVTPLCVVEGAYSQHPDLRDFYDCRVFTTIDPALQKARLIARNGEAGYRRFEERWIPLEERYFEAFDVQGRADIVIKS
ncbi:MAG: hypothetical protein LBM74_08185 [Oscillospiraceae bacterium]|jgi:uridine kinase|nr:hypothetical protein [Oscillospiraceae bacterium]